MTSEPLPWVWVPDERRLFAKAQILEEDKNGKVRVRTDSGDVREIEAARIEKANPAQFDKVGDMAELTYLNEPSVVNNLSSRWASGNIYTYSGLFLVAVNPYQSLPIYGPQVIPEFKSKRRDESEPHIYAVAEQAYRSMLETHRDQSILITGESGAGKTENTKKAIQYLSSVTRSGNSGIDERVLQTNPILEAFGNAQTIRNSNSSRFGKFIRIQFAPKTGAIAGASIQWYLLEKSRVLTQHADERNYHVFYQLLAGAPADMKKRLQLPENATPADFYYLKASSPEIPGVDDAQLFTKLVDAFRIMGFTLEDVEKVMTVVAAVLLLGQIRFKAASADQGSVVDHMDVARVCKLLGVDSEEFERAVLQPKVKVGREYVVQSRTASQAQFTIGAIAKALYERLFGYIVAQLNTKLGTDTPGASCIGVLDIAGFEIFKQNSFEQLCINHTNEKLQQFFNHHMFVLEQEEYAKEKVDWDYSDYGVDLQPTIDLIEQGKNPMGILSVLDEESVVPNGSDKSFHEKLVQQWQNRNSKFEASRLGSGFKVDHYATTVEYQTDGWIDKNKDPLSDAVIETLARSSNQLIRSVFSENAVGTNTMVPTKSKSSIFRTAAQRHKEQLNYLMTQLSETHPHFVRCIIPNVHRSESEFDNALVLDQLRCNGVLEGIRIARSGFPNRLEFKDFRRRYQPLASSGNVGGSNQDSQQACATILQRIGLDPQLYKVGLSKVFFRNGVLANLEHRLDVLVQEQAVAVQSLARGAVVRASVNRALHRRRAAKVLAATFRTSNRFATDPWWQVQASLKPLLLSKESMDNNRKDMRMQKMEKTLLRMKDEQVELISSKNELRGELISALQAKEELSKLLDERVKEQKEQGEAHELAITTALTRDEASTKALHELSEKHAKLHSDFDTLKQEHESLVEEKAELESKIKDELSTEIEGLKATLEKTQKELSDERTEREIAKSDLASTKQRLESSTRDLDAVKSGVSAAQKEVDEAKDAQKSAEKARDLALKEIAELKSEVSHLSETNTKSDKLLKDAEQKHTEQLKLLEDSKAQVSSKLAGAERELSELQVKFKARDDELATLNQKIVKLEEASSSGDAAQKKLTKANAELTKLHDWLARAKTELTNAANTRDSLAKLEKEHTAANDETKRLKQELETVKTEGLKAGAIKEELDAAVKRADNATSKQRVSEAQLKDANESLTKTQKQLSDAQEQVNKLKTDLTQAKERLSKTEGELSTSTNASSSSKDALAKAQAEISRLNARVTKAAEESKNLVQVKESLKKKLEEQTAQDRRIVSLTGELAQLRKEYNGREDTAKKLEAELTGAKAEKTKISNEKVQLEKTLRSEIDNLQRELAATQAKVTEATSSRSPSPLSAPATAAASFDQSRKLSEMRRELADTKKALMRAQTQAKPGVSPSKYPARFANGDIAQQLAETQHDLAASEAQIRELEADLASARREVGQSVILRQKYEKLQREKAQLMQEQSKLLFGSKSPSGSTRELELEKAKAANVKKLESEIQVLKLKLVRSERDLHSTKTKVEDLEGALGSRGKDAETVATLKQRLRLAELAKIQLEKKVVELTKPGAGGSGSSSGNSSMRTRNLPNIAVDSPRTDEPLDPHDPPLSVRKRDIPRALRVISNDRRVSEQAHLAADKVKSTDLEEALDIYKRRAAEFHSKLEKAELVVTSAMRAEAAAKDQVEELRGRLERAEDDHNAEMAAMRREFMASRKELDEREVQLTRMRSRAAYGAELDKQVKSLNHTLAELSSERDRLASDKARLERRLHDMVSSFDERPRKLQEKLEEMQQNEKLYQRDHNELAFKLERKDRLVEQLRRTLVDSDARVERYREELDRVHAAESAKDVALRRATREAATAHESFLMAERELEQYRLRSSRGSRTQESAPRAPAHSTARVPDSRPAFI